jgi:hypothetical protein
VITAARPQRINPPVFPHFRVFSPKKRLFSTDRALWCLGWGLVSSPAGETIRRADGRRAILPPAAPLQP